jgi:hypothetical protein
MLTIFFQLLCIKYEKKKANAYSIKIKFMFFQNFNRFLKSFYHIYHFFFNHMQNIETLFYMCFILIFFKTMMDFYLKKMFSSKKYISIITIKRCINFKKSLDWRNVNPTQIKTHYGIKEYILNNSYHEISLK